MSQLLKGKAYRYSFIYDKANLTVDLAKELYDYISAYQEEEERLHADSVSSGCSIYAYDDVIFIEEEETRVTPVYVVVLYGVDWQNFTNDLFSFHDTFPPSKIQREFNYSHLLKDESQHFDDFK
jgi:hypothetical protein